MKRWIAAAIALGFCAGHTSAGSTLPAVSASATAERHATTNALDGPVALFDWYTLLRGSVDATWQGENGGLKLGIEAEAKRFDTYDFENDRAAGLTAVVTRRLSAAVELRGTLTLKLASEGDDLILGNLIVPVRTDSAIFGAGLEAGIDLGGGVALVLAASGSREDIGPAVLIDGSSVELDPDTTRLQTSVAVRQTTGPLTRSIVASAKAQRPSAIGGVIVAVASEEFALTVELRRALPNGGELAAAFGTAWLLALGGAIDLPRPIYAISVRAPLGRAELRASLSGGYEYADTDDPLGSFRQRAEMQLGYRLTERVTLGSGLFAELTDNLLLGYDERNWGIYGEAGWSVSPRLALLWRVEYDATRYTIIGIRESTLDAFMRVRATM